MSNDWIKELVELINEKSREHSIPEHKHGYFNLMAQLARHEAAHAKHMMNVVSTDEENSDD